MKARHEPERRCIVTREARGPDEMVRFVAAPDGALVPDLRRKLPGRGVWVTASAQAVAEAMRRKAFARALKIPVNVPISLVEDIDRLLERDALQSLSMANKAGSAVSGFFKVESALGSGRVVALLHAREAAPDGVRKVAQAARRAPRSEGLAPIEMVRDFTGADLDLALGGAHVIHAALVAGPASAAFVARWRRLVHFRGSEPVVTADADAAGAEAPDGARSDA